MVCTAVVLTRMYITLDENLIYIQSDVGCMSCGKVWSVEELAAPATERLCLVDGCRAPRGVKINEMLTCWYCY